MGDVIHTLPALTDAQNAIPNIQFDWVIEENFAEIPRWHTAVNQIIPIAIRRWRKSLFSSQTWNEWQAFKRQLQVTQYDAVIDAQGLLKSAFFVTRLARGGKYGYNSKSAREGLSSCFYDKTFDISYNQHAVERIRKLFAKALNYPLPTSMGNYGLSKTITPQPMCKPYFVAIHSTTREDKHWPEAYWLELFQHLTDQGIEIHLPWGNGTEKARAERLAQSSSLIKVLPKLSLTELLQELSGAKTVISVDTGLSHLSAALDKPNIILYGATDPKLIGAYGKNQIYLFDKGMSSILPEKVLQQLV